MHPAASVIFFTVASGAGYGLLAALGIFAALGLITPSLWLGLTGFGLGLGLVTAGLMSSTFHLGHPERAWRALSQWRSSWLSREGIAAIFAYLPAGLLALVFTFDVPGRATLVLLGLLTALAAGATVFATAMIYRVLKPVHQWCNGFTVPLYLAFALATGLTLAAALFAAFGQGAAGIATGAALVAVAGAWLVLRFYWRFIDTTRSAATPESATGLGAFGKVRLLEAPHTGENFLLREMGYRIARKHAEKLRRIAEIGGLAAPAALLLAALVLPRGLGMVALVLAAACGLAGALVQRWLYFAQAKHTTMLYYGAESA